MKYKEKSIEYIQKVHIDILREVIKVADKHDIFIFPSYGTLLGIARHNNKFIPWDDDIDMGIHIRDVNNFMNKLREELPDHLVVSGGPELFQKGEKYSKGFIVKDISKKVAIRGRKDISVAHYAIDFFVYTNVKDKYKKPKNIIKTFYGMLFVKKSTGGGIQKLARWILKILISKKMLIKIINKLEKKYTTNEKTEHMMILSDNHRNWFKTKDIYDTKIINYYGLKIESPKRPENYLQAMYGPKWNVIPTEHQKTHYLGEIK